MTWGGRIRLVIGILVVLVVAALATDHLNNSRGQATSATAQIVGQDISVGTPYAGLVLDRLVEVGQQVRAGDPLFVIDSATLTYDLSSGDVQSTPTSTKVDADGHLVVQASTEGTVTVVAAEKGAFVVAGGALATLQQAGSLHVEAQLTLTPAQYARLDRSATVTVTLPDTRQLIGTVSEVRVTTVDGAAQAVLTVDCPELTSGSTDGLATAGTPVVAQVQLRNDGVVTTASEHVRTWIDGVLP